MNYYAIPAAAAVSFIFGTLWYSPLLLGKHWQKAAGVAPGRTKKLTILWTALGSFALLHLMALGLALFLDFESVAHPILKGLEYSLAPSIFFVLPAMSINYLYQKKPLALWAIDAGYQILSLVIMGMIMAAWDQLF